MFCNQLVIFQIGFIRLFQTQNTMSNIYSDHLELSTSPDKFMGLSMTSTNCSSIAKNPSNLQAFQDVQTHRTYDLSSRQISKDNDIFMATQNKQSFKKLTKRPILQQKNKNHPKKGNLRQKDQLQKKLKNDPPKYLAPAPKKDLSIQQLQMRCVQLDEQLKKLKLKHRRTTNNCSRSHKSNNQYLTKALITVQQYGKKALAQKEHISQNQNLQPTQSCATLLTFKSQTFRNSIQQKPEKNSHFFNKLKRKLNQQITKIREKSEETGTREVSPGCQIKKLTSSNIRDAFRTPVTDRSKSKTAVTRSGINTVARNSVKRKRPQSARERILQSKQLKYKLEKMQQQDNFELRGMKTKSKKERKLSKTNSNIRYSQPEVNMTLRHVSPLYKQQNWTASKGEVQQQKMKAKLLNILLECQDQSIKGQTIESGIKVFEAYNKQVTKRLRKKSKLLTNIQQTQVFEENETDQENQ